MTFLQLALFTALLPFQTLAEEACSPTLYRVEGTSMHPVIQNGESVKVTAISCHTKPLKKEDIILFKSGSDTNPLIKKIHATAGDELKIEGTGRSFKAIVNGETLKNSQGKSYNFSPEKAAMLGLYAGVLAKDTYLVLGENETGTKDASLFGLIHKSDVLGIYKK